MICNPSPLLISLPHFIWVLKHTKFQDIHWPCGCLPCIWGTILYTRAFFNRGVLHFLTPSLTQWDRSLTSSGLSDLFAFYTVIGTAYSIIWFGFVAVRAAGTCTQWSDHILSYKSCHHIHSAIWRCSFSVIFVQVLDFHGQWASPQDTCQLLSALGIQTVAQGYLKNRGTFFIFSDMLQLPSQTLTHHIHHFGDSWKIIPSDWFWWPYYWRAITGYVSHCCMVLWLSAFLKLLKVVFINLEGAHCLSQYT